MRYRELGKPWSRSGYPQVSPELKGWETATAAEHTLTPGCLQGLEPGAEVEPSGELNLECRDPGDQCLAKSNQPTKHQKSGGRKEEEKEKQMSWVILTIPVSTIIFIHRVWDLRI